MLKRILFFNMHEDHPRVKKIKKNIIFIVDELNIIIILEVSLHCENLKSISAHQPHTDQRPDLP